MALNLKGRFGSRSNPNASPVDPSFWDTFLDELVLILQDVLEKSASFEDARAELIQAALFRVNEILLPAFERVFDYQQAGFLSAPIVPMSEVSFAEGFTTVGIHPDNRDLFRPTPFVALTRETTSDDIAIARTDGYDPDTGALALEIVAVIGSEGPHQDVIVAATAGSVQAQHHFLGLTKAARDATITLASQVAADKGVVAADKATVASDKATTLAARDIAVAAAGTATGAANTAAADTAALLSGYVSAAQAARDAAIAAAEEAATFDPSSYYTRAELDHPTTGKADKSELFSGSYNDLSNKPALGTAAAADTGDFAAADHQHSPSDLGNGAALSVMGRSANSAGSRADIAAGANHQVLRRSGTAVGFGSVDLSQSAAVTGNLPVGNGGTGASTAAAARNNLGIGSMATRAVTISSANPSGGANGDFWAKV